MFVIFKKKNIIHYRAYVFFSSPIPKELVAHIKCDSSVIPRIGALSEVINILIKIEIIIKLITNLKLSLLLLI